MQHSAIGFRNNIWKLIHVWQLTIMKQRHLLKKKLTPYREYYPSLDNLFFTFPELGMFTLSSQRLCVSKVACNSAKPKGETHPIELHWICSLRSAKMFALYKVQEAFSCLPFNQLAHASKSLLFSKDTWKVLSKPY